MVVLEPSCAAVFRDELPNLMHGNDLAKRLAGQTFLLSEFLATFAPDFRAGELDGAAILHGHCHHRAIAGIDGEEALLRTTKLDVSIPDSGCCGMAGAFGFEREHYDLSVAVGNRALLPAVRAADRETMIVADGFSCREQIAQETGRRALHVAEVLALAMQRENLMQNDAPIPVEQERTHVPGPNLVPLVAAAVAVAAGGLLYAWGRRAISSRRMELDGLPREHGLSERYVLEDLWTNTAR